jgi:hypothetical protein
VSREFQGKCVKCRRFEPQTPSTHQPVVNLRQQLAKPVHVCLHVRLRLGGAAAAREAVEEGCAAGDKSQRDLRGVRGRGTATFPKVCVCWVSPCS